MTFTNLTKTESRCDACKGLVDNHWKTKQGHRCLTSATTNTKDQTS